MQRGRLRPEMLAAYIEGKNLSTTDGAGGCGTDENACSGEDAGNSENVCSDRSAESAGIVSLYPEQLKYNSFEYAKDVKREPLGDVLLTGAVGFLGIHVLKELFDVNEGKVICLVRKGSFKSPESRLKGMLVYYFGEAFEDVLKERDARLI